MDYVLGGSVPPPRNEKEILQDMEVQAPKETKRLYGTVTEMRDDYCLVDHRYHLQLNSLAKIGNHQPKLDDTVCVILTRRGQVLGLIKGKWNNSIMFGKFFKGTRMGGGPLGGGLRRLLGRHWWWWRS